MPIFMTEQGKSAVITYSDGSEDYKFEVWHEQGEAFLEYQETCSWRGEIEVSDPHESIYRKIIQSDEMTAWLDKQKIKGVQRLRPGPHSNAV